MGAESCQISHLGALTNSAPLCALQLHAARGKSDMTIIHTVDDVCFGSSSEVLCTFDETGGVVFAT